MRVGTDYGKELYQSAERFYELAAKHNLLS